MIVTPDWRKDFDESWSPRGKARRAHQIRVCQLGFPLWSRLKKPVCRKTSKDGARRNSLSSARSRVSPKVFRFCANRRASQTRASWRRREPARRDQRIKEVRQSIAFDFASKQLLNQCASVGASSEIRKRRSNRQSRSSRRRKSDGCCKKFAEIESRCFAVLPFRKSEIKRKSLSAAESVESAQKPLAPAGGAERSRITARRFPVRSPPLQKLSDSAFRPINLPPQRAREL